jgi:hypothetical protein
MATTEEVAALPGGPTAGSIANLKIGYGTSAVVGPASYTNGTFAPGAWISGNSQPAGPFLWIDPDNVTAGTYYLAYAVGGTTPGSCTDISIFTLTVVPGVDAGIVPSAQTFCADRDE